MNQSEQTGLKITPGVKIIMNKITTAFNCQGFSLFACVWWWWEALEEPGSEIKLCEDSDEKI